jgi:hypothetical protein
MTGKMDIPAAPITRVVIYWKFEMEEEWKSRRIHAIAGDIVEGFRRRSQGAWLWAGSESTHRSGRFQN